MTSNHYNARRNDQNNDICLHAKNTICMQCIPMCIKYHNGLKSIQIKHYILTRFFQKYSLVLLEVGNFRIGLFGFLNLPKIERGISVG